MAKSDQKYQFMGAMHQAASQFYQIGEQMDVIYRAYWANEFNPGGANAITEFEADNSGLTLAEISVFLGLCEQFATFFNGGVPAQVDARGACNKVRLTFVE